MKNQSRTMTRRFRFIMATLIPFVACAVQWVCWPAIQPFVWFLFYPAVFFSSWIGGRYGGVAATVVSAVLVLYVYIPPQFSFVVEDARSLYSVAVFLFMGVLFSLSHERLHEANRQTVEALAELEQTNSELLQLTLELEDRVEERTAELRATNEEISTISQQLLQSTRLATNVAGAEPKRRAGGRLHQDRAS